MIPAEAVEAAAKALAETCDPLGDWENQAEAYRGIYRRRIMPALKAAAPYMMAPRLDSTLNPEYPDGNREER